jgi:tRNA nucleotidyltransferase (CCA-adding enzyme)
VLDRLEDGGFPAYVVGGCVRDTLIDAAPRDWDVASPALPAEVAGLFVDTQMVEIGKRHGTLGLVFPEGIVEVTTFRSDGEYLDGRRPATVRFVTSIADDLARRDFTMNALAFRRQDGLLDPFGGRRDIDARLIRCVGDPTERLREDALRIMRALRFAATLGFDIDEKLAASLHEMRGLLARIAPERVSDELLKMLVGPYVLPVLLAYPDVLAVPLPEIAPMVGHDQRNPYHRYDIWEHTAHAIAAAKPDPLVRFALLAHDMGKPDCFFTDEDGRGHFYGHARRGEELIRARMKTLRFGNEFSDRVARLVADHQRHLGPTNMLRWLNRLGEQQLRLLLEVKRGDIAAHADDVVAAGLEVMRLCEARLDRLLAEQACFSLRDLAVNGEDLKGIGFEEGPEIGRVLAGLLAAVIGEELRNDREELLDAATRVGQTPHIAATRVGQTPHIMDA